MLAFFHKLKQDIGLLGLDINVSQLIDRQNNYGHK